MAVISVHADNDISGKTTFQKAILGAILDDAYEYTAIDESLVVLAAAGPKKPQFNLIGRLLSVDPDGTLHGIVERIEIFANAAATEPSVAHLLDGEQLLADLDFSAHLGSGPLASQNYGAFYQKLGSFSTDHAIHGSDGDDVLETLSNTDLLRGFKGNDTFLFYGGTTYDGGQGIDVLDISASGRRTVVDLSQNKASDGGISDLISIEGVIGSNDDDGLIGNNGRNTLKGKGGDDDIEGGGGKDRLFGGSGNDSLEGGKGDDLIDGGSGDDRLIGGADDDEILGKDGDDTMFGETGDDTLRGGKGRDTMFGEAGRDNMFGDRGNDTLSGGERGDILNGGNGKDLLLGDEGNDELIGGRGADSLYGGAGDDDLWGLGGNDRFVFFGDIGNDTIHDYKEGSDTIRIGADAADVSVEQQGQHSIIRVTDGGAIHVIEVLNSSVEIGDIVLF